MCWYSLSSFLLAFYRRCQPILWAHNPLRAHNLQCQGGWLTGRILPRLQCALHPCSLSQPQQPRMQSPTALGQLQVSWKHPTQRKAAPWGLCRMDSLTTVTYPGRVHHALGCPCRARGEHDEQRVAKGQLFELQLWCLCTCPACQEVIQEHAVGKNMRNQQ